MFVVNKVDDLQHEANSWEFLQLGAGEPHTVSALHGRGSGDLLDYIVDELGEQLEIEEVADADDDGALRVAIVGRPNVGKSTLFNQLIGEERSVVHDMPGTTRDAIDTVVQTERRVSSGSSTPRGCAVAPRLRRGLRPTRYLRSLDALDRADIAVLVIDATIGATGQDQRLAERISAAGCPALVVLNKWELVHRLKNATPCSRVWARNFAFLGDAPVMKTTATRKGSTPDLAGAFDRRGGLREARADRCAQPGDTRLAGKAARSHGKDPLRGPGCDRATHVHVVRRGSPSRDLHALRGTLARERFKLGSSPFAYASGWNSGAVVRDCDRPVEGEVCEVCGEQVPEVVKEPMPGSGASSLFRRSSISDGESIS